MEYKVVHFEDSRVAYAVEQVQTKVNALCEKGWNVQGGIAIIANDDGWYDACQAMVKY